MKKIGIFTLDGFVNFGNRLQNYALQAMLQKEGYEVETIVVKDNCFKNFLRNLRTIREYKKRALRFILFTKKYISIRMVYRKKWDLDQGFSKKYDYFMVGSDQVWNPNIRKRERNNFFLKFARKEQRISVAASFAVNELEEKDVEIYREGLKGFSAISVRENEGAKIVKDVSGKEAVVLCDPTIALGKEEWDEIATLPPIKLPPKYLVVYFLGRASKEREESIKYYAKKNGLEIINISDKTCKKLYEIDPSEFIGLIKNATLVCTDSFHGVVFSTIYNVPFFAFYRDSTNKIQKNMESRITTLQKMLGMKEKIIGRLSLDERFEVDYSLVNKKIEEEQKRFKDFISNAIKK